MLGKRLARASSIAERQYAALRVFFEDERMKRRYTEEEIAAFRERRKGIYRKTKTECSCYMCGNPRKFFGEITYQEMKAEESTREQMEELNRGAHEGGMRG